MFELGDFVRIKEDFDKYESSNSIAVNINMLKYAGRTCYITKKTNYYYKVSLSEDWVWDKNWLEFVPEEPMGKGPIDIDEDSFIGVFQNV